MDVRLKINVILKGRERKRHKEETLTDNYSVYLMH